MKRTVVSSLCAIAAGFVFILSVGLANVEAQMPGSPLRARIPFEFNVRGKTLPAGDYEIKRVYDTPDILMIAEVGRNESDHAIFNTEPVQPRKAPNRTELIFHRYGDSYFLSEILTGYDNTGRELLPSREEKVLKREMISRGDKAEPQVVAVAIY